MEVEGGGRIEWDMLLQLEYASSSTVKGSGLEECRSQDDGSEEKVSVWRDGGHESELLRRLCRLVGTGGVALMSSDGPSPTPTGVAVLGMDMHG